MKKKEKKKGKIVGGLIVWRQRVKEGGGAESRIDPRAVIRVMSVSRNGEWKHDMISKANMAEPWYCAQMLCDAPPPPPPPPPSLGRLSKVPSETCRSQTARAILGRSGPRCQDRPPPASTSRMPGVRLKHLHNFPFPCSSLARQHPAMPRTIRYKPAPHARPSTNHPRTKLAPTRPSMNRQRRMPT